MGFGLGLALKGWAGLLFVVLYISVLATGRSEELSSSGVCFIADFTKMGISSLIAPCLLAFPHVFTKYSPRTCSLRLVSSDSRNTFTTPSTKIRCLPAEQHNHQPTSPLISHS